MKNVEEDDRAYDELIALGFRVVPRHRRSATARIKGYDPGALTEALAARDAGSHADAPIVTRSDSSAYAVGVRPEPRCTIAISPSRSVSQDERVLLSFEPGEQVVVRQFLGCDPGLHVSAAFASRLRDELQPPARCARAAAARAGVTSPRCLLAPRACGVSRAPSSTFASAAVFAAASQPSTSSDASASAMPARCIARERGVERLARLHRGQDDDWSCC